MCCVSDRASVICRAAKMSEEYIPDYHMATSQVYKVFDPSVLYPSVFVAGPNKQ